jgi:hypothetical protein
MTPADSSSPHPTKSRSAFKYAAGTEPGPQTGTVDAGTGLHDQDGDSFTPRPGPAANKSGNDPVATRQPLTYLRALQRQSANRGHSVQ